MNNDGMLPDPKKICSIRNNLIHSLFGQGMTPEQIEDLDLKSIRSGTVVLFHDGSDLSSSIALYGEGKRWLNLWQIIRPRGNPKSDAFMITLRGKNTGKRMSKDAIKRIIGQQAKPLADRFREHGNNPQDKPKLRVIQGGR